MFLLQFVFNNRFVFSLHFCGGNESIRMDGKQDLCVRSVRICVFQNLHCNQAADKADN